MWDKLGENNYIVVNDAVWPRRAKTSIIIPTLNKVDAIGGRHPSGSTCRWSRVLELNERGYDRACAFAATQANEDCNIIVFMDGDGADRGDLLEQLVAPIQSGTLDFAIAARARGLRELGFIRWPPARYLAWPSAR
jgi:hypothetical protein